MWTAAYRRSVANWSQFKRLYAAQMGENARIITKPQKTGASKGFVFGFTVVSQENQVSCVPQPLSQPMRD